MRRAVESCDDSRLVPASCEMLCGSALMSVESLMRR